MIDVIDGAQPRLFGVGLLCAMPVLYLHTRRRGTDPWRAIAVLTALVAAGLFGGRVGAWVFGTVAIADFFNPNVAGSTSTMAAAFVGLAAIAVQGKLGMRAIDDVSPSLWVMVTFARLGCVFQGCDFGRRAIDGVAFSANSPAWYLHVQHGWIAQASGYSASTAPFAALAVGAGLFALAVSLRPFNGALASSAAYLALSFFVEFFREPLTTVYWGPLSRPQWLMLAMLVVWVWVFRQRDRQGTPHDAVS
ncbi:MAG: hypothetical protein R3E66_15695 [bacterium]